MKPAMTKMQTMQWNRRQFLAGAGAGLLTTAQLRGMLPATAQAPLFRSVPAARSGITWVHDNGKSAMRWLPESMCSGCAFFDFDNDGWMDIFLVNTGPSDFYTPKTPTRCALYKNNRDGTFTDVTVKAGLEGNVWGEGVAIGDFDRDGWPDLYLTAYGANKLYRNNRDGTFTDVTKKAGVAADGWSTSAVWFDYDNDGKLDLFVCSFVEYSHDTKVNCGNNALGVRYYCTPRMFTPRPSLLFHNNGDGTFTEVGHSTAIGENPGKAHGVVAVDLNGDGRMDLFVSNDTAANYLFMNRGNGKWEEIGFSAGVAFGESGRARSGMGVDAADYDNDGKPDLFVANIDHEQYALYHNDGNETFSDHALQSGIGPATMTLSGWGLKFFDFDNDGDLDLILSNGHPDDMVGEYSPSVTWKEPLLLFRGDGKGNFANVSKEAGPEFAQHWGARGLALGDFNNDGRLDVLINNNGGAPLLLRNESGSDNHWLGLKLVGTAANIDAVGAIVTWTCGATKRSRQKVGGGSYLSSQDPRMVLGLGKATKLDSLSIQWPLPSGRVETFKQLPIDRYITIVEGKGVQI